MVNYTKDTTLNDVTVSAKGYSKFRSYLNKVFYEGLDIGGKHIDFNTTGYRKAVLMNKLLVNQVENYMGGGPIAQTSPIQSGFYLSLYQNNEKSYYSLGEKNQVSTGLITSFDIPQLGVTWQNAAEQYFFTIPQLTVDTFSISFIPYTKDYRDTVFYEAYESLFSKRGTLKIRSKDERYNLLLYYYNEELADPNESEQPDPITSLIEFHDVRLSHPKLSVDLKSNDFAVYSTNVAYDYFTILENSRQISAKLLKASKDVKNLTKSGKGIGGFEFK